VVNAMKLYGMHLGTAFQLIDDVLDYQADADELGKNIGDDLAEGKPTLPLIYALRHTSGDDQQLLRDAIEQANGMQHLERIMAILERTKAFDYTRSMAEQEAEKARQSIAFLPQSSYKDALLTLADIAVQRSH
jgi:octaprenyl-diphosphate synthase